MDHVETKDDDENIELPKSPVHFKPRFMEEDDENSPDRRSQIKWDYDITTSADNPRKEFARKRSANFEKQQVTKKLKKHHSSPEIKFIDFEKAQVDEGVQSQRLEEFRKKLMMIPEGTEVDDSSDEDDDLMYYKPPSPYTFIEKPYVRVAHERKMLEFQFKMERKALREESQKEVPKKSEKELEKAAFKSIRQQIFEKDEKPLVTEDIREKIERNKLEALKRREAFNKASTSSASSSTSPKNLQMKIEPQTSPNEALIAKIANSLDTNVKKKELTEEDRKKIERNRLEALRKKEAAKANAPHTSSSIKSTQNPIKALPPLSTTSKTDNAKISVAAGVLKPPINVEAKKVLQTNVIKSETSTAPKKELPDDVRQGIEQRRQEAMRRRSISPQNVTKTSAPQKSPPTVQLENNPSKKELTEEDRKKIEMNRLEALKKRQAKDATSAIKSEPAPSIVPPDPKKGSPSAPNIETQELPQASKVSPTDTKKGGLSEEQRQQIERNRQEALRKQQFKVVPNAINPTKVEPQKMPSEAKKAEMTEEERQRTERNRQEALRKRQMVNGVKNEQNPPQSAITTNHDKMSNEQSAPKPSTSDLTEEQRQRAERNKQEALKRLQRQQADVKPPLDVNSNVASTSKPPVIDNDLKKQIEMRRLEALKRQQEAKKLNQFKP